MYSGRGIQEASESNYVTFMELHRCLLLCSEPLSIVCLHNFHCFFNITFKKVKKKKVKILTTQIFTFKWQSMFTYPQHPEENTSIFSQLTRSLRKTTYLIQSNARINKKITSWCRRLTGRSHPWGFLYFRWTIRIGFGLCISLFWCARKVRVWAN